MTLNSPSPCLLSAGITGVSHHKYFHEVLEMESRGIVQVKQTLYLLSYRPGPTLEQTLHLLSYRPGPTLELWG